MAKKMAGGVGPNVRKLEKVAGQSQRLEIGLEIDRAGKPLTVSIKSYSSGSYFGTSVGTAAQTTHDGAQTFSDAMTKLLKHAAGGQPRFDSVTVKSAKCPLKAKELKQLAVAAWAEFFGVPAPSDDAVKESVKKKKDAKSGQRDELVELLRGGPKGVKQWNAREADVVKLGKFPRVDLAGADLRGVIFPVVEMDGANFEGARMEKATISSHIGGGPGRRCSFKKAIFKNADLTGADIRGISLLSASFEGAKLAKAHLDASDLRGATLKGADLKGAGFMYANLRGADLSDTNFGEAADFANAQFDETTKLPAGLVPPKGLLWRGKGVDPRIAYAVQARKPAGPLDFDAFMKRLEETTDPAKLNKALSMLKADSFKLYAQVGGDFLSGVVKSQTDAELVYSCRLSADGVYGCCTQNLNICGGLRGSLCKHLLVLIVGLAKNGELDPTATDTWVEASRMQKPALDKDQMSETFLRYKGAEAGEVDWRPTETIPEDYYAL